MRELTRKATAGSPAAAALRAEAEVLGSCEAPGLPVVVRCGPVPGDDAQEIELVTAVPPGVPVAHRAPLEPEEAAGVTLAVGTVLLDLADRKVAHEPIAIEQVHLAAGGKPALTHLAGAGWTRDAAEPIAADVASLLLRLLPPPVPSRRWQLIADHASPLRALAHRAADPAVSLAVFLDRLRTAAPGARLPSVDAEPGRAPRRRPRPIAARRAHAIAAVAVGVAALAALAVAVRVWSAPKAVELAAPNHRSTPPQAPTDVEALAVWPRPECQSRTSVPPECAANLRVDGLIVRSGTRSWELQGAGDYVLALFDVDCSQQPMVVALDRASGDVWRLPRTGPGTPMQLLGHATGGDALAPPTGGCGIPRATDADGAEVPVVVARDGSNEPARSQAQ